MLGTLGGLLLSWGFHPHTALLALVCQLEVESYSRALPTGCPSFLREGDRMCVPLVCL